VTPNGESKCPSCLERHKTRRDYSGALVFLIVLLTFGIAYIRLLTGEDDGTLIPPWAIGFAGPAVAMYLQRKAGERMREMTREKGSNEPTK
jgi:hypothetical protein